jgi:hypothetical protein
MVLAIDAPEIASGKKYVADAIASADHRFLSTVDTN